MLLADALKISDVCYRMSNKNTLPGAFKPFLLEDQGKNWRNCNLVLMAIEKQVAHDNHILIQNDFLVLDEYAYFLVDVNELCIITQPTIDPDYLIKLLPTEDWEPCDADN